ncbi:MAG: tRNA pseudouridine(13) synthase TruD [Nanoarchaeota archaeon]|nr:tRNA pseudouridine(13) synthase TruD [Nanoarchaeota archaeon]
MEMDGIKNFARAKLGGEIKKYPEDFIVEEITPDGKICTIGYNFVEILKDLVPKERREHLHFTLVKKNWTTLRAVSELSKRLRVSRKRFGFAGTKDRRAITAQRISVWNATIEQLKKIKIKDITIKDFNYSNKRITLGDLYGNRFTITIRNANVKELGKVKKILEKDIPNFFGPQRFGIQRRINHLIGKQLLLGNFEGAAMILITSRGDEDEKSTNAREFAAKNWGKWREILKVWPKNLGVEAAVLNYLVKYPKDYANAIRQLPKNLRRMFIHSFQSYIFNRTLEELINRDITVKEIPLVGYETKLEGETGEIIKKILKEENIKLEHFKLKRMPELAEKGDKRDAWIKVENLKILNVKNKEVKLQFTLKKGAYATTILGYIGVKI